MVRYNFDLDFYSFDKNEKSWVESLSVYKQKNHDKKWVFLYGKTGVFIYDRFPKGFVHLLMLPYNLEYAKNVREFDKKDTQLIMEIHKECREVARNITKSKFFRNKNKDIVIGYHLNPSMKDIHIHLISTDFIENKNSRSFYDSEIFIGIQEVEKTLKK